MSIWHHMEMAPRDGSAFLAYGRHDHSPPDAQRGVVPGDHWWGIILWDVWRESGLAQAKRWVFAKDGSRAWSEPLCWTPLEVPHAILNEAAIGSVILAGAASGSSRAYQPPRNEPK